jgi:hypothetical protein
VTSIYFYVRIFYFFLCPTFMIYLIFKTNISNTNVGKFKINVCVSKMKWNLVVKITSATLNEWVAKKLDLIFRQQYNVMANKDRELKSIFRKTNYVQCLCKCLRDNNHMFKIIHIPGCFVSCIIAKVSFSPCLSSFCNWGKLPLLLLPRQFFLWIQVLMLSVQVVEYNNRKEKNAERW